MAIKLCVCGLGVKPHTAIFIKIFIFGFLGAKKSPLAAG
jgi:hypothetical protein